MKSKKTWYWISTGLLCAFMVMAASNFFLNYAAASDQFSSLGYPTYLIYPLGVLKLCGVIVILANKCGKLVDLAYAGFFYNFLIAFSAHLNAGDPGFIAPVIAFILLAISYYLKPYRNEAAQPS